MNTSNDGQLPSGESSDPDAAAPQARLHIVGIGASAGGLRAVSELLHALPAELDMAVVVVMHLDPTQPSSLAKLLGDVCPLPAQPARDGLQLEAGHVYVISPNTALSLRGGRLSVLPREDSQRPQRPIDLFLCSLAEEHASLGVGVILSGTGSDGTTGLLAIEAAGGISFAQDDSAEHGDMPASAIAAGCVDAVLPPEGIARELVRVSQGLAIRPPHEDAGGPQPEDVLDGLVSRLSRITGIGFSYYKQATVRRRIERRLLLLGLAGLEDYVAYFDQHPEEAELLCRDVLVRVTGFFRDPDVFHALSETVLPDIVRKRSRGEPIRIWTPGCATGEEVYSIAISLLESLGERASSFAIKLFGTDVSAEAVSKARAGRYPKAISAAVSPERLQRFFVKAEDGYVVSEELRDLCVFAQQDATRDPPFSNLDLISCRNLLIYLGPALQRRVLPVFHYALREGGYLLLGTSESVGAREDLFASVNEHYSLYVRKSVPRRLPFDLGGRESGRHLHLTAPLVGGAVGGFDVQREADRLVLAKYAPPGVLVDEEGEILQFRGDTGAFLTPAPGPPGHHLLRMARQGLLPALQAMLAEAKTRGVPLRREGLRIRSKGRQLEASVELTPIRVPGSAERYYAVLFEEASRRVEDAGAPASQETGDPREAPESATQRAEELERELLATREYLHANVERLEAANEELRAANEEILSSNEELQSTNEELQTAKEELQATNEELQHRNREAALLSDDLSNLIASVKVPMLMFSRDLVVRRFTPSAGAFFGVPDSDMRLTALDLAPKLLGADLQAMLLEVLDTLGVAEREVQDRQGRWYALRIHPYRTHDRRVDGAVLTLSDIDALKRLAQRLEQSRDFAETILMSVRVPLLVIDDELSIQTSNTALHELFGVTPDALESQRLDSGAMGGWATPQLLARIAALRDEGTALTDVSWAAEIPGRGARHLLLNAHSIPDAGKQVALILLAIEDVTDSDRARVEEERLAHKLQETQRLESLGVLAGGIAHDFNNILAVVLGFAELILSELPPDSPARPYAKQIVQGAERAADLCRQMLAYSGKGRFEVVRLELSELVEQSRSLLEAMVRKGTTIHYDLASGLPSAEADTAQIRQVLANLVINASEALGEGGGTIAISTGVIAADRAYLAGSCVGDVAAGEYVYLEVADEGQGMSPETQAHIFDPFFTTKFTGRGLGLAAVLGIVRGHQGALKLESRPGRGSTFRLLLPARPSQPVVPTSTADAEAPPWRGGGTVLVVDDEADVRSVLAKVLPRLGFRVVQAANGAQVLELLRGSHEPVDLVLLDLTMPGWSAARTYRELCALRPGLRFVLMSGYDEEEAMRSFPPGALAGFLRKPFALKDLEGVLRNALPLQHEEGADGKPPP